MVGSAGMLRNLKGAPVKDGLDEGMAGDWSTEESRLDTFDRLAGRVLRAMPPTHNGARRTFWVDARRLVWWFVVEYSSRRVSVYPRLNYGISSIRLRYSVHSTPVESVLARTLAHGGEAGAAAVQKGPAGAHQGGRACIHPSACRLDVITLCGMRWVASVTKNVELSVGLTSQFISSKPTVYLLKDRDPIEFLASRSAEFSLETVLIGRTDFDTTSSILDPTLNLRLSREVEELKPLAGDTTTHCRWAGGVRHGVRRGGRVVGEPGAPGRRRGRRRRRRRGSPGPRRGWERGWAVTAMAGAGGVSDAVCSRAPLLYVY
jgi:hypothetical protein